MMREKGDKRQPPDARDFDAHGHLRRIYARHAAGNMALEKENDARRLQIPRENTLISSSPR